MNHCSIAYTFYERDFRVRRYSEMLVQNGNRVDVIALKTKGELKKTVFNGVNVFKIQNRDFNEKGRFDYFFKIIFFFIKGSIVLLFNHFRFKYHIIHIHNVPDFLVFMTIVPKLLGVKIILDIHDILPELYCEKFNRSFNSLFAKILLIIEKISINFSDYVIVANDLWRNKIIDRNKLPEKKCIALLNYADLKFFKGITPKHKIEQLRLIYPGHISHHHGIDIAIKGFAIIKKHIKNAKFDIYPSSFISDYRKSIELLIKELHLEDYISFFKPYKFEEISSIFSNASIGIVPKRGGLFTSEAFSTKIFEFMAAGVPVVASKTKIDQYYFDDSMIKFFEQENHEDMAIQVIELFNDLKERKRISKNGLEFVSFNNWDYNKQKYSAAIENLL